MNSSHRGPVMRDNRDPTKDVWHIGSSSRVVVPARCMVMFHANLYHYVVRSMLGISSIPFCHHAFAHMPVKGFVFPPQEFTNSADYEKKW